MKRLLAIFACVLVVGLVLGAIAYGLTSDGPAAYSVRGTEVSQSSVDAELAALADNQALQDAIRQATAQGQQVAPVSTIPGTVTSTTSAGWLGLRIAQTGAAQAVERQGLQVTQDDKTRGHELAVQSLGGDAIFSTMPEWFRNDLNERWTDVAVLETAVLANPTPALQEQIVALCPSGRYVSHIQVDTEAQAASIKQALDRGGNFAEIAKSTSKDGSAKDGGALGCVDGAQFVEPFASVAASQPIGVVSDPVQTEFGYHLILVTGDPPAADVQQVALQTVLGQSRDAKVTVDERYGRWDARNGQVVPPLTTGTSAGTQTATPSGSG
jgi:peptidyl-prolyl cis-trans isomerase C